MGPSNSLSLGIVSLSLGIVFGHHVLTQLFRLGANVPSCVVQVLATLKYCQWFYPANVRCVCFFVAGPVYNSGVELLRCGLSRF